MSYNTQKTCAWIIDRRLALHEAPARKDLIRIQAYTSPFKGGRQVAGHFSLLVLHSPPQELAQHAHDEQLRLLADPPCVWRRRTAEVNGQPVKLSIFSVHKNEVERTRTYGNRLGVYVSHMLDELSKIAFFSPIAAHLTIYPPITGRPYPTCKPTAYRCKLACNIS